MKNVNNQLFTAFEKEMLTKQQLCGIVVSVKVNKVYFIPFYRNNGGKKIG